MLQGKGVEEVGEQAEHFPSENYAGRMVDRRILKKDLAKPKE